MDIWNTSTQFESKQNSIDFYFILLSKPSPPTLCLWDSMWSFTYCIFFAFEFDASLPELARDPYITPLGVLSVSLTDWGLLWLFSDLEKVACLNGQCPRLRLRSVRVYIGCACDQVTLCLPDKDERSLFLQAGGYQHCSRNTQNNTMEVYIDHKCCSHRISQWLWCNVHSSEPPSGFEIIMHSVFGWLALATVESHFRMRVHIICQLGRSLCTNP